MRTFRKAQNTLLTYVWTISIVVLFALFIVILRSAYMT